MRQRTHTVYGHVDGESFIVVCGADNKTEAKTLAVERLRSDGYAQVSTDHVDYSGTSAHYSFGDCLRVS